MNRFCTCAGGAGLVLLGSIGLVALPAATSSGLGPATGACCYTNDAGTPGDPSDDFGDCTVTDQSECENALLGTYVGDLTDCSECSQNNCLKADTACQEPNIGEFPGGTILSAGENYDNFIPEVSGTITSICSLRSSATISRMKVACPRIKPSGVRSSCEAIARKSDFIRSRSASSW